MKKMNQLYAAYLEFVDKFWPEQNVNANIFHRREQIRNRGFFNTWFINRPIPNIYNHEFKIEEDKKIIDTEKFKINLNYNNGRYYSLLMSIIEPNDLLKSHINNTGFMKYVTNEYEKYTKETGKYYDTNFINDLNNAYSLMIKECIDMKKGDTYFVSYAKDPYMFLYIGCMTCDAGSCFNTYNPSNNFFHKLQTCLVSNMYLSFISDKPIDLNNIQDTKDNIKARAISLVSDAGSNIFTYNIYSKSMNKTLVNEIIINTINANVKTNYSKVGSAFNLHSSKKLGGLYTNNDGVLFAVDGKRKKKGLTDSF